jgi:hypothetical protein
MEVIAERGRAELGGQRPVCRWMKMDCAQAEPTFEVLNAGSYPGPDGTASGGCGRDHRESLLDPKGAEWLARRFGRIRRRGGDGKTDESVRGLRGPDGPRSAKTRSVAAGNALHIVARVRSKQ